ncbi:MAG: hypothetical protein LKCHEGNO_03588 [Burkholderiaceae bacterium]|nr:hypothetical protein [Burkholderiaceae bacterium]
MLGGDVDTGKAILCDHSKATVGFEQLGGGSSLEWIKSSCFTFSLDHSACADRVVALLRCMVPNCWDEVSSKAVSGLPDEYRVIPRGRELPSRTVASPRRLLRSSLAALDPVRKTCYFSDMKASTGAASRRQARPPRSSGGPGIEADIARRVRRAKPGTVFTPALFAGVGSRAAIDKALQRLAARGDLRRLSRGLYDKPRQDPLLGTLWPSVDAVVAALTGKDKLRLQPTGAYAANLLGLSDQVPARVEFLTDGTSRTVKAGPMQIVLKRTTPRQMAAAGRTSGLVIQALRSLGAEHLTPQRLTKLRRAIPAEQRRALLDDLTLAPGWLQPTLRALAAD